jgi:gliding motility-associated-like protein
VSLKNGSLPPSGVENLKVYSNIFGFEPDGKSFRGSQPTGGIDLSYCKGTIAIGGPELNKRNIFGNSPMFITGYFTGRERLFPTTFLIQNNYFSYDIEGKPSLLPDLNTSNLYAIFFNIRTWIYYYETISYPYAFRVLDNKIQAPHGLLIARTSGDIIMQGNTTMLEYNPLNATYAAGSVQLSSDNNIRVGGENPGEGNVLYGEQVHAESPTSILIQHSSIYCVGLRDGEHVYLSSSKKLPEIEITSISSDLVKGKATANSKVELFWDDDCKLCQPKSYINTVMADASGDWKYEGKLSKGIIASATLNGFTSLFTKAQQTAYATIIHTSCGKNSGSIKGIAFKNAGAYQWKNSKDEIIGTQPEINNLAPGKYTFSILNSTCSESYIYEILDATPKIEDKFIKISQPSCNKNDGSVTYLYQNNYPLTNYTYSWKDLDGRVKSTSIDLQNAGPGTYFLEVYYNNDCKTVYGPVTLNNQTGLSIDQTGLKITSAKCNSPDGAARDINVNGTGKITYTWRNEANQIVGNTKDLLNVFPGKYILEVKDETSCGLVKSLPIEIPETNGILIDNSKIKVSPVTCLSNNGSIKDIIVTGATNYSWSNEVGQIIATTLDLQNIQPGKYKLSASNTFCTKETALFTVLALPSKVFSVSILNNNPASCGLDNGSITLSVSGDQPKTYKWRNASGAILSTSASLTNAPAGRYKLYLADDNGCENFYQEYTIADTPPLSADQTSVLQKNDNCNLNQGGVRRIKISGGKGPYVYLWTDKMGKPIGSALDIQNLSAGIYQLEISDATSCNKVLLSYVIQNVESQPSPPNVPSTQVCAAGKVKLQASNPIPGKYLLYDAEQTKILAESSSGSFETDISKSSDFYVSYRLGDCESDATLVHIIVGITAENIPNKISPNGDGINDQWLIEGLRDYPNADVKIYSRSGTVVYQSKGYLKPFDGTQNGSPLPVGPYYYTIDFGGACNKLSGNLNLLR